MKKTLISTSVIVALTLGASAMANAATEVQKEQAIKDGLAWMAGTQQANGSWSYDGGDGDTAATAAALLAFQEQKGKSGGWYGNDVAYQAVVDNAYTYILNHAQYVDIGPQTYGNPDTNGNGLGVKFVPGGANGRDTYVTGLVLPALARYGNLSTTITAGALAGKTYSQAIQDTVDYFAWGQNESGWARGGWRYYANSGDSDNSTAQWPVVGMMYAQAAGATIPTFVKDEMKVWIDYIQHSSGGSGYDSPGSYTNESKTGGLLLEMKFSGYDGYKAGDTLGKQEALNFLDANWQNGPSGTWWGNFGHPYAMWGIYKGLETTIGLANTTEIANLHAPGTLDAGDTWNWWEDYSEWLVNNQNGNGSWTGYDYWPAVLATPWYINILNATKIPDSPVPEPSTMLLFGAGIVGLARFSRRKKN